MRLKHRSTLQCYTKDSSKDAPRKVTIVKHASTTGELREGWNGEFDIHITQCGSLIISHDKLIKQKSGKYKPIRSTSSENIAKMPPQLNEYLSTINEHPLLKKHYFLEMKGTGVQGEKDKFPKFISKAVIDNALSKKTTIISFHRRNIEKIQETYPQLKTGLLFRAASGYQEGKSIGSSTVKDGTVKSLTEISESLKEERHEKVKLCLHDTLILNSFPKDIKEFAQSVGENRDIAIWQMAEKTPEVMNFNMIKAQRLLKQAGHKGECYLITDHYDATTNLAKKED